MLELLIKLTLTLLPVAVLTAVTFFVVNKLAGKKK